MPFIANTPESLISRNDSKNPATTCKGITASGRPCRRALAASPNASPSPSPGRSGNSPGSRGRGVLALLRVDELGDNKAAAFYCWQHKDQAVHLVAANNNNNQTEVFRLTKRSSIDTITERLGILDIDEEAPKHQRRKQRRQRTYEYPPKRRDTLPLAWHDVPGPLMTVPEAALEYHQPQTQLQPQTSPHPAQRPVQRPHAQSNVKASFLCCIRAVDDEPGALPMPHRPINAKSQPRRKPVPQQSARPVMAQRPSISSNITPNNKSSEINGRPTNTNPSTPSIPQRPSMPSPHHSSHTQALLSLIPNTLSPQITSSLLTELARPISPADESGYIYIFWLTPSAADSKPSDEDASNLLAPPSIRPTTGSRRGSDALRTFATPNTNPSPTSKSTSTKPPTVLLKIGRASNVHRRLNQWTRQCGYNVTLIRYYPYHTPHHQSNQSSSTPQKVPHVHRVERLIHLELSDKRATKLGCCESCGKEHREWFEIEGSKDGVRAVDEVVRRWVGWGESVDR